MRVVRIAEILTFPATPSHTNNITQRDTMSKSTALTKTNIDNALKTTTKELRQAQRYCNHAFNVARSKVTKLHEQFASTPRSTFALSEQNAATPVKTRVKSTQVKRTSMNEPQTFIGTPTPMAASEEAVKNIAPVYSDDASPADRDDLKEDVVRPKTPANTPVQTKVVKDEDDNFVLVHSSANKKPPVPPKKKPPVPPKKKPPVPPKKKPPVPQTDGDTYKRPKKRNAKRKFPVTPNTAVDTSKCRKKKNTKDCPNCGAKIATACRKCPHCGGSALKQDERSKRERKRRRERAESIVNKQYVQTESHNV